MDVNSLNWIFGLLMGTAAAYLIVTVIACFESSAGQISQQQMAAADSSLAETYVGLSPELFFLVRLAVAVLFFAVGLLIVGPIVGLLTALVGFAIPWFVLLNLKKKRIKKLELQLIDALELLGNSIKSGLTLPQSVELVVREFPPPISQEFSLVLAETRLGKDFTEALEAMAARLESNIVHILATGVSVVKRCGGDLSVIFSNIAQTIRDRATVEGKLEAVTAQGRFQGLILGLMPFVLVVVLYFVDRQHVETLFTEQIGIWAFSGVCIMVILAQLWIRKLLAIDV